ncbi:MULTISPECIES: phage tail tape measure protein [unclassified Novosphingobium]|uniref:phage tail tape measure protein n=1 Tax=unclassified Novosphingobium TaxID=2644732 RepID=UPI00086D7A71|nr:MULTISPECIES: phage tail tape measure protein [unclassified Novosphingobium]MBN9146510.1 phage tail tape measure protein [Novosphingobium sp.]MDR6710299.1 TP901 family phage tail tape measure protein [Novosphingobium sp. 1748]ODU78106.1 MAG: phage tail tape measure protein [Novosphingobium sp. SCN 63-17]OJX91026.1 MAG: phage tail tape measure protein [Novosphingobium sp. 63-713]
MSDKKLSLLVNFIGIDKMTGIMKNIVGLGRDGSKSIKGLTGETKKLDAQMRAVQADIAKGAGNMTQLIDKERALAAQIALTNRQLERQKKLAAIRADANVIQRRGADLRQRGQDNMLGGVGMATPFILASKAAMDFSSGMVDIQQKAELTNAETARMAARILDLSKVAHQLPEDMRSGIDTLAGLGLDPRKAIEMIGPIGRLGTAFKVDLADGANAAFSNLNNLKVPIGETARALDIMAASGNAGAFEVKDMARWFPSLTAQMQALGQKGTPAVADLAAALQIARRGAGDADQAANNIQNLLSKIQSPETVKKFAKFGIDLPNALKKAAREGKTPLETIADLTQKATGGDNAKIGNLFEDMQAQGALRSLILNMEDFRKMRADIAKSGGTVDKAFAQREAQDASIKWRDFMGTVQRLGITLGNGFLPAATRFLSVADGMISRVAAFAQANPRLTTSLMTLLGVLVAARIGVGALQWAVGGLFGPVALLYRLLKTYEGLAGMVAIFPRLAGGMSFLGAAAAKVPGIIAGLMVALRGLAAFMLTNPAGWFLLAVGAGVAAYQNWDWIKEKLGIGGAPKPGAAAPAPKANWAGAKASNPFPALAPVRPAALGAGGAARGPVTLNVYPAPGQSPDTIANHVIRKMDHAQGVAARSNMNGEDGR